MGWWTITEDSPGLNFLSGRPLDEDTGLYNGDGPADIMGCAVDELVALFEESWERKPYMVEVRAAVEFASGHQELEEKPMDENKHTKVRVPGEAFWAIKTDEPDVVVIDKLPVTEGFRFGDKVRIDSEHNVVEVIENTFAQYLLRYDGEGEQDEVQKRWERIVHFAEAHEVQLEGMVAGSAVLAIPKEKATDEFAQRLVKECPVKITLDEMQEVDSDEEDKEN